MKYSEWDKNSVEPGGNIDKEPIKVRHSELTRFSETSVYKSKCLVCKGGLLLVYRNPKTMKLMERDRCVYCAQEFIYEDIDKLRFIEDGVKLMKKVAEKSLLEDKS